MKDAVDEDWVRIPDEPSYAERVEESGLVLAEKPPT